MKEWSFVCPILIAWMACSGCSHTAAHYIDAGNRYYQGGRYEDASLQYRKALQRDPNSGEAYYRLGLTAIRRTDLPAGFADLQRAAAMLPSRKDVADSFQQATVELADFSLAALRANAAPRQRYHDEAVKLANLLLSNNAKSYEGLRLKGDLALLDGAPQAAIEFFKMADAAKPMQPAAILGWVQALFAVGENQQGEELGRTLIRHAGSFTPAYRVLYFEYIGRGRTADGEALLREQIQNNPKDTAARLQLAAHYARFGTPPQVQAVVAEVLDHASEFREAHLMVGDFYNSLGRSEEAIRQFQQGMRGQPKDSILYRKRIAATLARQGKRNESLQLLEQVLRERPSDRESLALRAGILLSSGKAEDLDRGIADLRNVVQQNPGDFTARLDLARAEYRRGNVKAARADFLEAGKSSAGFIPSRLALGQIELEQRKPEVALSRAQEILATSPRLPAGRLLQAAAWTAEGNYIQARAELLEMEKEFPHAAEVQMQLGMVAAAAKDFKTAEAIFHKLQGDGPVELQATAQLAQTYSLEDQNQRALEMLTDELKRSPDSMPLRELLATAAVRARKYDLALEQYRKILGNQPASIAPRMQMARIYAIIGDNRNAIAILSDVTQHDPKNPEAALWLAERLTDTGQTRQAIAQYRRALALQPDNPEAANNLAFLLSNGGGSIDEALRLAQQAVQHGHGRPNFFDTLGWIYLKKNMRAAAVQIFSNLVQRDPREPAFYYHLGAALAANGEKDKAREALRVALAKKPSRSDQIKIQELLEHLG